MFVPLCFSLTAAIAIGFFFFTEFIYKTIFMLTPNMTLVVFLRLILLYAFFGISMIGALSILLV